mmetsp:Transcript_3726/g.10123  ORF Transcript_3726/g.10123 Transcript_3726/m.10123 type:complete len:227 (+) Transcript_3726:1498-2178(+)
MSAQPMCCTEEPRGFQERSRASSWLHAARDAASALPTSCPSWFWARSKECRRLIVRSKPSTCGDDQSVRPVCLRFKLFSACSWGSTGKSAAKPWSPNGLPPRSICRRLSHHSEAGTARDSVGRLKAVTNSGQHSGVKLELRNSRDFSFRVRAAGSRISRAAWFSTVRVNCIVVKWWQVMSTSASAVDATAFSTAPVMRSSQLGSLSHSASAMAWLKEAPAFFVACW